jgi:hypothetical protein
MWTDPLPENIHINVLGLVNFWCMSIMETSMTTRDGGKGDKPRPIKNWDHYKTNWDLIFEKGVAKAIELENEKDDKQKTVPRN